jgi:zona occludens toxin
MSITLITGVPGSGKTLKAVWDHLRLDVGKVQVSLDEWGREVKTEYKVFTNINSLKIDHEFIEGVGTWSKGVGPKAETADGSFSKLGFTQPDGWRYEGNPEALRNWHNWAKPGTKIYFDEFQKFWPPRPNGAPVPPDVQALDTHRHMGVDFVVITQNCRNVDRHLLGLVDRHLHVRRVSNMPLAVVYEWDHASVNLNYKNAMTKSPWRYPKKAYTLYKSAELHTKQSRKLPGLLWFIIAGFAGAAYAIPSLKERLSDRIGTPIPVSAPSAGLAPADGPVTFVKDGTKYTVETTTTQAASIPMDAASTPSLAPPAPVLAGCIRAASRCACFDTAGFKMEVEPKQCLDNSAPDVVPKVALPELPQPRLVTPAERDLLAFMHPGTAGR